MEEKQSFFEAESAFATPRREYTAGESAFAWFCIAAGYLLCRGLTARDLAPMGLFLTIALVTACTAVLLFKRGYKPNAPSVVSGLLTMAFAASLVVTRALFVNCISLFGSFGAYCYFVRCVTENRQEKGLSDLVPVHLFYAAFVYPFRRIGQVFYALIAGKATGAKNVAKVFFGLLLAVIPTITVVALLSYDEDFAATMDSFFAFFRDFDLPSQFASLLVGIVIAMYLFGTYAYHSGEKQEEYLAQKLAVKQQSYQKLPLLTVAAAILPLMAVYSFYFLSQWQYYVAALGGSLPDGVDIYAEYARSGFFQLCIVSVINLVTLYAVWLFLKREKKSHDIFLKVTALIFSAMTLVLIATAMAKMLLYIHMYGLTMKRALASWMMLLLGVIFVLIILKQFFGKLKLAATCSIAVAAMTVLLSFSNLNGLIADYNVNAYLDGRLESVDVQTLAELGEPAVPALVKLAEHYRQQIATSGDSFAISASQRLLEKTLVAYRDNRQGGLFCFSLPRHRAEKALEYYFKTH